MSSKTSGQIGFYGFLTLVFFLVASYALLGWVGVVILLGFFSLFMFIGSVLIGMDEKRMARLKGTKRE